MGSDPIQALDQASEWIEKRIDAEEAVTPELVQDQFPRLGGADYYYYIAGMISQAYRKKRKQPPEGLLPSG